MRPWLLHREKFGTTVVLDYYNEHGPLVRWVQKQRKALAGFRDGKNNDHIDGLTGRQAELLEEAGLTTTVTSGMRRIARANNPPPPELSLSASGLSTETEASALAEISRRSKSARDAGSQHRVENWEEKFSELLEYRRKHDTLMVVAKEERYKDLEEWVKSQIVSYAKWVSGNKKEMNDEQARKLEVVGFPIEVTVESMRGAKGKRQSKQLSKATTANSSATNGANSPALTRHPLPPQNSCVPLPTLVYGPYAPVWYPAIGTQPPVPLNCPQHQMRPSFPTVMWPHHPATPLAMVASSGHPHPRIGSAVAGTISPSSAAQLGQPQSPD